MIATNWVLYHFPLCPYSRCIRLMLHELNIKYELHLIDPWEIPDFFWALNPAGTLPVLTNDQHTYVGFYSCTEGLLKAHHTHALSPQTLDNKLETCRLVEWFWHKFDEEVTSYILTEKVIKRLTRRGPPDSLLLRAGRTNLSYHLEYITYLAHQRSWLAGDTLSVADLCAGAHLSCLEYVNELTWKPHLEDSKIWYMRLKSRPSFQSLLTDRIEGIPPAERYAYLDI
jgi:glutathione S-transferase